MTLYRKRAGNASLSMLIIAGSSALIMVAMIANLFFSKKSYDTRSSAADSTYTTASLPTSLLNGKTSLRHFSWIGVPQRQFTDDEIAKIATQSAIEVIPKFHAQWDYNRHHLDADRLKRYNKSLKVLVYQSARFVFPKSMPYEYTQGFRDEWLLLAESGPTAGQPVSLNETDKENILYMDLSKPELRAWVIGKVRQYMNLNMSDGTPLYDGIALDSARFIADAKPTANPIYNQRWYDMLSLEKINAWNEGMRLLLQEFKAAFPNKMIVYNGFEDKVISQNRNLSLFEYVDAGLNEDFCIHGPIETREYLTTDQIQADIDLMVQYAKRDQGKILLQKTNFSDARNADEFARGHNDMARYCYGIFMLGAYGDRTYFKSGGFYNSEEVDQFALEGRIRLGVQKGDYKREGDLFSRVFDNGFVYVNTGSSISTFNAPADVVVANGAVFGEVYKTGQAVSIPPHDSFFLLKLNPEPTSTILPTEIPTNTPLPPSPTPTTAPTSTPLPSPTPKITPTFTPTPTNTPTPTLTPTLTPTNTPVPTRSPTPSQGSVIKVKDQSVANNIITNTSRSDFACEFGKWCKWQRVNYSSSIINQDGSISVYTPARSGDFGSCWIQWLQGAKADGSTYRVRATFESDFPLNTSFIQLQTYNKVNYLSRPWYTTGRTAIDETVTITDSYRDFVAIKFCSFGNNSTATSRSSTLRKISVEKM